MIETLERALALAREAFDAARASAVHVPEEELLAGVALAQRLANVAAAVQAVRVAQYASREHVRTPTGGVGDPGHGCRACGRVRGL